MFKEAVSGNRCCSEKLGDRASQDRNIRSGDSVDLGGRLQTESVKSYRLFKN